VTIGIIAQNVGPCNPSRKSLDRHKIHLFQDGVTVRILDHIMQDHKRKSRRIGILAIPHLSHIGIHLETPDVIGAAQAPPMYLQRIGPEHLIRLLEENPAIINTFLEQEGNISILRVASNHNTGHRTDLSRVVVVLTVVVKGVGMEQVGLAVQGAQGVKPQASKRLTLGKALDQMVTVHHIAAQSCMLELVRRLHIKTLVKGNLLDGTTAQVSRA